MTFRVLTGGALSVETVSSGRPETPEPAMIDEQLFQILYGRTAGELRAYAARVLGNAGQADDIVQESYLRLVRSPPATTDLQHLRAWLFRIASHLIVDHWRRTRREQELPDGQMEMQHARELDMSLRVDMARTFQQLSPQQRQMMWLAYVEGNDHAEIAAALNVRPGSVRVLLHRARRKLAALLRERGPVSVERGQS
jgi:RNA polymerase sigma-70 factor (ECF subfamily)